MKHPLARLWAKAFAVLFIFSLPYATVQAQAETESDYDKAQHLPWHPNPSVLHIQSVAVLNRGPDLKFLDPDATNALLRLTDNLPEQGAYAVAPKNLAWWSLFTYQPTGHDSDGEKLDQSTLLTTLQQQ